MTTTIVNVHGRVLHAPAAEVGALIDALGSDADRLWPSETWPPLRFAGPLAAGVKGGHGPVRYVVEAYRPGRRIRFRFTAPAGFEGTHGFSVEEAEDGLARLVHR